MPAHWCVVCGKLTNQETVIPPLAQLEQNPHWHCYKCFSSVAPQYLYCPECGDGSGHVNAENCRQIYVAAGVSCVCASNRNYTEDDGINDIKHTVIVYLCYLAPVLLSVAISDSAVNEARFDIIATALLYGIGSIFILLNWRLILPLFKLPKSHRLLYFLVPFIAASITVLLALAQAVVFPFLDKYWVNYSDIYLGDGYGWPMVYLMIAVLPAFFEELMFRGVIMQRFFRVMTPVQSIVVTAMFFGILHLTSIGFVFFLVPMAVIAGWLTWKSGSILPAILLHFLHNGAIITLELMEKHF